MNVEEFRYQAKRTIDYVCEYRNKYDSLRVYPGDEISVGYLKERLPSDAPEEPESFDQILDDFEKDIMPGIVHWNHPGFFAYFPTGGSYASLIGDMLSSAFNQIGFSWRSSPALTEHEQLTMNMFARALDLPTFFMSDVHNSVGGGAMQNSASDCIMLALIAARCRAVGMLKPDKVKVHDSVFLPNFVAYTSEEAHSCVQKAAKIAIIKLRVLPTDERGCLRGDTLAKAVEHDVEVEHLTPIFVSATVGTTGTCAFDKISEIGAVCKKYPTIWFHVDGAYGGNSFILPEMRKFKEGLEYADSFNVNPNKLLLTCFDCSCFWVKNLNDLKNSLSVNPTYLEQGTDAKKDGIEFRHFGIPLSRRFRSLKLWCVLRSYGLSGLRQYIRHHQTMAKHVEANILGDDRFTLENTVHLGLVCFRIRIEADETTRNRVNIEFCERLNASGKLHLVPTTFHGRYIIRFCVTNENATFAEIDKYWKIVQDIADDILDEYYAQRLAFQQANPRPIKPRYSFAQSVPRNQLEQNFSKLTLKDGGSSIVIVSNDQE